MHDKFLELTLKNPPCLSGVLADKIPCVVLVKYGPCDLSADEEYLESQMQGGTIAVNCLLCEYSL